MAEALALVASIAGVAGFASLAMQLGQGLIKLIELHRKLGDASDTLNHAILSIMTIETQLQMIQTYTMSSSSYTPEQALIDAPLELCYRSIRKVNGIIDNIERSWKKSERFGKLMVTMKDREMRELLQQLDREQSMLSLAVQFYAEATRRVNHDTTALAIRSVVDRLDRMEDAQSCAMTHSALTVATQNPALQPDLDDGSCVVSAGRSMPRAHRRETAKSRRLTLRLRLWSFTKVYSITTTRAFHGWDVALRMYNVVPYGSPILEACRAGDLPTVRLLIAEGRASPLDQDLYGNTTLFYATYQMDMKPNKSKALIQYLTSVTAFPDANINVSWALLFASNAIEGIVRSMADCVDVFEAILDNCEYDVEWAAAAPTESLFVTWAFVTPELTSIVARRLTSPWASMTTSQERFEAAVRANFCLRRLNVPELLRSCGAGVVNRELATMTYDGISLLHIAAASLASGP
ncbi:hypothetical protein LTR17_013101 [Elasticomyces elasticus]|nr:hypothetical protein LTR17_013101 [Elasticomyces elasticus]